MQLGKFYSSQLWIGIELKIKGLVPKETDYEIAFPTLHVDVPMLTYCKTMDDAKELFKKGNTQFKKSLEFFVLDGYVTEHSWIKKEISELYKHLITLE